MTSTDRQATIIVVVFFIVLTAGAVFTKRAEPKAPTPAPTVERIYE